jgi:2-polyprenyl-3-methyl-5-hydroxy-6-metoxy-1,4-benzoquinol methylase
MSAHSSPTAVTPGPCKVCGAGSWTVLYEGPIRVGRFGRTTAEARPVLRCGGCGVGFLPVQGPVDYESAEYRELVDGDASPEAYYRLHDGEQAEKLRLVGPGILRGRVVADVGCGAGSFLDVVGGLAASTIAIEPTAGFHDRLRAQGHTVYPYAADAARDWRGRVDVAVCFSVVEHVEDPVRFLDDVRALLRPGGLLVLSTPNLRDWMLDVLPDDYGAFFFRAVHTWYFDVDSLGRLAQRAGYAASEVRAVHRFDLSNALLWLRDRRPSGLGVLPVSPTVDAAFARWLESEGRADYLYATLRA